MGLDMYLYNMKKQENKNFLETLNLVKTLENEGTEKLKEIYYWRRAYPIHEWFKKHIQNGYDDSDYYNIEKEDLENLIDDLQAVYNSLKNETGFNKVKINKEKNSKGEDLTVIQGIYVYYKDKQIEIAKKLLPVPDSAENDRTEYNEYYLKIIEKTLNDLTIINNVFDFDNNYLVYQGSW